MAAFVCVAAAAGLLALPAQAQTDYPSRPIKLIVPFPAGGTSDVMGRMIAEELTKALKQPVVVENLGGAGGVIGTEKGARAAPDGYTLIQTGVGQNAVAHGLNPKLGYDSNKDFFHITKLSYGYVPAASGHMAMELLKQTVGTCSGVKKENCKPLFMVGIPYRGGGPMLTDILGGQIPLMFINQDVAQPHIKAGKLRALAVTSLARNPLFPDVPTIHESGYPGFSALSWSGLSLPKGTPKPIVDKIEAAAVKAMQSPAIRARMEANGFVVPPQGSVEYTQFVARELDRWTRVIKIAGIKGE
ncbi:MAG: tripartite tricarboxylate transporter substrate binding protein [Polaromonas sp.]|nr:tripartite tricarboxylate transporter substrate binding protein [Polaromonas sp.]